MGQQPKSAAERAREYRQRRVEAFAALHATLDAVTRDVRDERERTVTPSRDERDVTNALRRDERDELARCVVTNVTGFVTNVRDVTGGAGGGLLSISEDIKTLNPPLLSSALNARDPGVTSRTVTEPVTDAPRHELGAPIRFYVQGDEAVPAETLAACQIAGYQPHVVAEEWAKFILNQSGKGAPVTTLGLNAAFCRAWLPRTRRVQRKAVAMLHEDDLASLEAQKIRERESARVQARVAAAKREEGPPTPEVRARLAELQAQWERESRDVERETAPQALRPWTPPTDAQRATIEAELAEEMRKAGGLQ